MRCCIIIMSVSSVVTVLQHALTAVGLRLIYLCTPSHTFPLHPSLPSFIVCAQGASAFAKRVLQLYADEEDYDADGLLPRNLHVCCQYLSVLAREPLWEEMLEFFWQMVERGKPHPDENCYRAVLDGLHAAGRWKETVKVMDTFRMQELETKPNRSVYLSALSTLLKVVSFFFFFSRACERACVAVVPSWFVQLASTRDNKTGTEPLGLIADQAKSRRSPHVQRACVILKRVWARCIGRTKGGGPCFTQTISRGV